MQWGKYSSPLLLLLYALHHFTNLPPLPQATLLQAEDLDLASPAESPFRPALFRSTTYHF